MRIMASGAGSSINLRQNKRQRHYTYRVNVTAPFVFIREIAPLMMRQGWGGHHQHRLPQRDGLQ
jgi:short-subunit dehydrogenase